VIGNLDFDFVITDYISGLGALTWVLGELGLAVISSVFEFPLFMHIEFPPSIFFVFCSLGCSLLVEKGSVRI